MSDQELVSESDSEVKTILDVNLETAKKEAVQDFYAYSIDGGEYENDVELIANGYIRHVTIAYSQADNENAEEK